jgi:hypothetical protein
MKSVILLIEMKWEFNKIKKKVSISWTYYKNNKTLVVVEIRNKIK